jgi:2-oxoglutarate dehydrogenase E2 component (dihydrolipoamide succinyltransferase)
MPEIEDAAFALWETPGQRAWRHRAARSAAIVIVVPLWLGACAPADHSAPAPLASPGAPITVEPSTGPIASPGSPSTAEPSTGPIALAPTMTGAPAPEPAPLPEPAPAAPEPLPPPAPAPAEAAAVETPAAPSPCPPGQIAVISKPDMAGTPVVLCRRPYPPR